MHDNAVAYCMNGISYVWNIECIGYCLHGILRMCPCVAHCMHDKVHMCHNLLHRLCIWRFRLHAWFLLIQSELHTLCLLSNSSIAPNTNYHFLWWLPIAVKIFCMSSTLSTVCCFVCSHCRLQWSPQSEVSTSLLQSTWGWSISIGICSVRQNIGK